MQHLNFADQKVVSSKVERPLLNGEEAARPTKPSFPGGRNRTRATELVSSGGFGRLDGRISGEKRLSR
ncbi:hypothetical protein DRO58_01020 [Candidatus Bathyarchaeota archaeon]|nr:MAG: hypothetical protein DRO58_01020 [Candidatus Bathyarchaeota archaeon]